MAFTGHVFLGMSVDGFISRPDDALDFLDRTDGSGEPGDAGFTDFVTSVDALLMGRGTYRVIAGVEEWPYQGKPVHVVSSTLDPGADPRITVHRSLDDAVGALDAAGYRRVYLDGGSTVRQLLARGRVQTLCLSRVPVLVGEGFSLFGPLPADVDLEHVSTEVLGGGMVQTTYRVRESSRGTTA
ncbi:dihydrofolate reductase family protein [Klenkia taihuensis]|uniref:Dihydrofolate reductase n=1 Tax=Klenkia taihuensis TaxID=1225127 RepID=A0A1I1Q4F4_9ACTN|nr:dihydrofolate reductase family protein [Klenkia taihuensis]GHE08145.1 deaminase reductase [Klenkia taihuensis]SFD17004.1 Dihydrofolate reductase [Klenkia taihuensis]